ncbi:hypothetical protein AVEN_225014-1 [Araneus ventricosus]|uniref:Uncharacterized protein n=1 Tax=Araneus ventricosus TaxID=182803 RepID=A0A4Y2GXW2_ARAVE|nr:hypothetical protein AVEN_225014-1 [Araneus ventricosus]
MWFYIFGVLIVTESQVVPHFFMWNEDVASRGSNKVVSSLLTLLEFNEILRSKDSDSDRDLRRIEKNLRKHETIFLPEQYREIIMESGRNHHVTDMTPHFRNFKALHSKLQLTSKKKECPQ